MLPFRASLLAGGIALVPSFLLNFSGATLPGGVTASGATNGMALNSSGNFVAATAPRWDYSPASTGTLLGLLNEPAATNPVLQSATFSNATWTKSNASVTSGSTTSPDGTSDAQTLVENTTNAQHYVNQISLAVAASTTYCVSLFAKASTRSQISIQYYDGSVNRYPIFDLSTQTKVSDGGIGSSWSITAYPNGWYRIAMWMTSGPAASSAYVRLYVASGGTTSYAGTAGYGIYLWNCQMDLGTSPSSPIITTTAAVTRTADAISFTVPAGVNHLYVTFDNGSQQLISTAPGAFTVPTTLNRTHLIQIEGAT